MPAVIPFIPLIAAGIGGATALYSGYKADKQNQAVQQQMQNTQNQQMGLFSQAQQLIPGMQNISNLYGQGATGFLADRDRLGALNGQYGGLMDQMNRLYNSGGIGDILTMMRGGANVQAGQITDGGYGAQLAGNASAVMRDTNPEVYREQARLAGNDAMGQIASQLAGRGIASSGTSSRLGASTLSRLYADAAARGQQDRLNAYGISNNALGAAGNMALNRSQGQVSADLQAAGIRNSALGAVGNLAMSEQAHRAGLLTQISNMLGAQQGNILAGSGLLGNFLQGLQGQYGMQQGIGNMYNNQAGLLGGIYNQQQGQINPNPYGGFGAALGAFGNAGAQYLNWQAGQNQQPMTPFTPYQQPARNTGGPFGVSYSH